MSTTYVQRVKVIASDCVIPIKVAPPYNRLPGDLSLAGSQAQQHTQDRVIYDKTASINIDQERVFASYWGSLDHRDFLDITIGDFPNEYSNTRCEVSFCRYDSDHPWSIGPTIFTSQHWTSGESTQSYKVRPDWVRNSGVTALSQPFGIWGEFVVVIWRDMDLFVVTPPICLELYWLPVVARIPPLLSSGVPLQLLRMFVLPGSTNCANSREEWIKMVVAICFGSRKPYTGAISTTFRHWLKFDTLMGIGAFTGLYGSTFFDVVKWVDAYRNWKLTRYVSKVNYFDQAAIVQTVLSLGMPFRQIHWEYYQMYGFIGGNDQLVGWGDCNNPYFESRYGDRSKQVVADNDLNRQPFHDYVYLTLTNRPLDLKEYTVYNSEMSTVRSKRAFMGKLTELQENRVTPEKCIVDACTGPYLGNMLQKELEKSRLEINDLEAEQQLLHDHAKKSSNTDPEKWKWAHRMGPGILVPQEDQPGYPPHMPSHATVAGYKALLMGSLCGAQSTGNLGGSLRILETAFEKWFYSHIGKQNWQNVTDIPVRPTQLRDNSFVFESRIRYTRHDEIMGSLGESYSIAMRILICPNAETTTELLARYLATLVHTSRLESMTVYTPPAAGVSILGNSIIRAFTLRNIAIVIIADEESLLLIDPIENGTNIAQVLAAIAVEMLSIPGNCWADLL